MFQSSERSSGTKAGVYVIPPKHEIELGRRKPRAGERQIYDGGQWKEVSEKAYRAVIREEKQQQAS